MGKGASVALQQVFRAAVTNELGRTDDNP